MKVWYMNGAGNDFMVIDGRGLTLDYEKMAVELCALRGADGFMVLDHSESCDFKLHFYNSDGSRGEMCGNGARCICRFAHMLGIAGDTMVVETDAGPVPGWYLTEDTYRVQLNTPEVIDWDRIPEGAYVELGNPGIPHAVVEIPGLKWEMRDVLRDKARALRYHPKFPKGANVNLYTWVDAETVRVLTYERGVEDYTLACGTGSGSTAAALWAKGQLPGGKLTVIVPGGVLKVDVLAENHRITHLYLEGPTQINEVLDT